MNLQSQLREYATRVESEQRTLTPDEVQGRQIEDRAVFRPPDPARPSRLKWVTSRGPLTAVVAAAITLVLFGLLSWILESDQRPPAETVPAPTEGGVGYYAAGFVPEGHVLVQADARAFSGSRVVYLNYSEGRWLPDQGGFAIDNPIVDPAFLPNDVNEHLRSILSTVPGAIEVEVDGRPGILLETQFVQGGLAAPQIWLLVGDGSGGLLEVTSIGMSREDVLAIAAGVERMSAESFLDLASSLDWELLAVVQHDAFVYEVPEVVERLATDVEVALGVDLLTPTLYRSLDEGPQVTTEDGSIVVTDPRLPESRAGYLFLQVPEDAVDQAMVALAEEPSIFGPAMSPRLAEQRISQYIDHVRTGSTLSERPYVLQAPAGPTPEFDTSRLGEELPLVPAPSAEDIPPFTSSLDLGDAALATEDRPVVVIGTVHEPGRPSDLRTMMVWFSEAGGFCEVTVDDNGRSSSCGHVPLSSYGVTGESTGGGSGSLTYAVPLDTSVVQIVTEDGTYWQRPMAGYGIIPYGQTLDRPSEVIAFDAEGDELGRWAVPDF